MKKIIISLAVSTLLSGCGKLPVMESYTFDKIITQDSIDELKSVLESNKVKTLYLNSLGGKLNYAMEAESYIKMYDTKTVVRKDDLCSSACVYMFMAGRNRELYGQLGLHEPSYNGIPYHLTTGYARADLNKWKYKLESYAMVNDVREDLIAYSYTFGHANIHYMDAKEFGKYDLRNAVE